MSDPAISRLLALYHPQICHFAILNVLSCRHMKRANARRGFLWTPIICLKIHLPKGNQYSEQFHQPSRTDSSEDRRPEVDTIFRETLSQTIILLIYASKGPFMFLKNHLLSPKKPPSLWRWCSIVNSEATSLSYSFFLSIGPVYVKQTC